MTPIPTDKPSSPSTRSPKLSEVAVITDAIDRTTPPTPHMDKAKTDMATKPSATPKSTHDVSQQSFTTLRRKQLPKKTTK